MERDLTNREWLAYWTKVTGEVAKVGHRGRRSVADLAGSPRPACCEEHGSDERVVDEGLTLSC